MSINKVIVSGNLTRDPELRNTAGGMAVLGFGVAVNDRVKNQQTGEWEDRPNFIDCAMFGKRAESVQRFLGKGSKVAVEGKLRWSSWEKNGEKRSKVEVVVDEIELMSQRPDAALQAAYAPQPAPMPQAYAPMPQAMPQPMPQAAPMVQAYAPQPQAMPQQPMPQQQVYDEDIPF